MIKLAIFDFDGIFTDGKIIFDNNSNGMKYYNTKDGMGIFRLHDAGFEIGVISGLKDNVSQQVVLNHLKIKRISLGSNNKLEILNHWCSELNITLNEVAYMGDDINNIELMNSVKLVGCPKNAHKECLELAQIILEKNGGDGCIREFCDYILEINNRINGKITAIIGVRKGSKRLKNKNIKKFHNTNLLELKIKTLLNCKNIDNILVTSDCDKMLEVAGKYDIITHKREDYYASDECPTSEYFKYLGKLSPTYNILFTCVTSPFVQSLDYYKMIEKYKTIDFHLKYDSLIKCVKINEFIFYKGKPIGFELDNQPKSQDINNLYKSSMSCSILNKNILINNKSIIGNSPYFYQLNDDIKCLDIDYPSDFIICELLYKNNIVSEKDIYINSIKTHILNTISNINLIFEPYPHIYIDEFFPKTFKLNLPNYNDIDDNVYYQDTQKTKKVITYNSDNYQNLVSNNYHFKIINELFKNDNEIRDLIFDKFKEILNENIENNLENIDKSVNINYAVSIPKYSKEIHVDRREHLINILYYNVDVDIDAENYGGNLELWKLKNNDSKNEYDVFPPKKDLFLSKSYKSKNNSAIIMINLPNSYHSVKLQNELFLNRKYIYIVWDYEKNSRDLKDNNNNSLIWKKKNKVYSEDRRQNFLNLKEN